MFDVNYRCLDCFTLLNFKPVVCKQCNLNNLKHILIEINSYNLESQQLKILHRTYLTGIESSNRKQ